jgi:hypothetical protein
MVISISVNYRKFLERSFGKLKAKEPIKYEQIRQDLWKKPGGFQETI